jgi:hypothetical protein
MFERIDLKNHKTGFKAITILGNWERNSEKETKKELQFLCMNCVEISDSLLTYSCMGQTPKSSPKDKKYELTFEMSTKNLNQ